MQPVLKDAIYDIPEICPIKLNGEQVAQMFDLFSRPGWGLLMQIRKNESEASCSLGMSLTASEEGRTMARGIYHKQLADLYFAQQFEDAVAAANIGLSSQSVKKEK